MLRSIPPSGSAPLADTPLYCTACGGPAPRLAATILLVRSPSSEVLNVEVQVWFCAACDLPFASVDCHATPLEIAPTDTTTGRAGESAPEVRS